MRAVWTIARRELRALFDHPTGYLLLIVFVAITDFLFFRIAYQLQSASLRPLMDLLPWLFLFFVPAVTMRALAEDARSGTIEVVLAQPITEVQLLAGKYLGQVLFIWTALGATLPVVIGLSFGADLHGGVILAQYVGAALLAVGMAGVGVWSSSVSRHQVTAAMIGMSVLFLFILLGLDPQLVGLPPELGGYAAWLSVLSHFSNIARGVIDLRDIVYFASLAAVFLFLAYQSLMARKLAPQGETIKRLRLGVLLLAVSAVVVNLFGRHIGGRLDLTPGKAYTLSRATRAMLGSLPDYVTIKFYTSQEVPPEFSLMKRDVEDLLSDFRSAGKGKVRLVYRDPGKDSTAKAEAAQNGIPPVQFNVMGRSELQVKQGYMGLMVSYANAKDLIPTIQRTDDLEYRLATFVRQLTRPSKPLVGWVNSQRDAQLRRTFNRIQEELRKNYDVQTLDLNADSAPPAATKMVILAGTPDSFPESQQTRVLRYLQNGGSVFVFSAGMALSPQSEFAQPLAVTWNPILRPYGVEIKPDMVFDRASNRPIAMPTAIGRIGVSYPFWLSAVSTKRAPANQEVDGVFLPWAASIDTAVVRPGTLTPLFITSRYAGAEGLRALISPGRQWPSDSLRTYLVAAQINTLTATDTTAKGPNGRLVVVGSTDFCADGFLQPENMTFFLNAADWLAQDTDLISIRSKDRTPPRLLFGRPAAQDAVKYANVFGVPVLLIVLMGVRLLRRKQMSAWPYQRMSA